MEGFSTGEPSSATTCVCCIFPLAGLSSDPTFHRPVRGGGPGSPGTRGSRYGATMLDTGPPTGVTTAPRHDQPIRRDPSNANETPPLTNTLRVSCRRPRDSNMFLCIRMSTVPRNRLSFFFPLHPIQSLTFASYHFIHSLHDPVSSFVLHLLIHSLETLTVFNSHPPNPSKWLRSASPLSSPVSLHSMGGLSRG